MFVIGEEFPLTLEDSYASFDITNTVSIYRAENLSLPDLKEALG